MDVQSFDWHVIFWYNEDMKKQTKKILKAFTLIEIVVVIAIMGIMSSLFFVNLSNNQATRAVETNSQEFMGVVREAQNHALSGKQLVTGTDPCRYEINWGGTNGTTNKTFNLKYWYKNASGTCNQSSVFATYSLKPGVTFASGATFYFTLPHAALDFASGSRVAVFTKAGVTHSACIYSNGRITDQVGASCP